MSSERCKSPINKIPTVSPLKKGGIRKGDLKKEKSLSNSPFMKGGNPLFVPPFGKGGIRKGDLPSTQLKGGLGNFSGSKEFCL